MFCRILSSLSKVMRKVVKERGLEMVNHLKVGARVIMVAFHGTKNVAHGGLTIVSLKVF